jgi:hypothetical protein
VTFVYTNTELREQGMFFVRLYGKATVHHTGPTADKVWERLIDAEKGKDPDRKDFAILVEIERVEDLQGNPIAD